VDRRPALFVQQVQTYNAVGVDVRVHGYGVRLVADEDDLGSLEVRVSKSARRFGENGSGVMDGMG
jgi:hypothetical protein